MLGAAKDDDGVVIDDLKDAGEGIHLCAVRNEEEALRDVVIGAALRLHRDLGGVVEVLLRKAPDSVRHGGREKRHLLAVRGVFQDALDILLEAHVQHLIGLIEDEELQLGQVQRALLQVVDDATRGTHDDLRTAAQTG